MFVIVVVATITAIIGADENEVVNENVGIILHYKEEHSVYCQQFSPFWPLKLGIYVLYI